MEAKPPAPRAILVGIQVPRVDDVAHAASIEELGRLVKTLGYEVVGTISQKRDGIGGGTVLGKGRLAELAAITGGTGVVGSMAIPQKSKARERFENADEKKSDAPQIEPDEEASSKPEFVIVDHEISPSEARNLERATGAQVLDRTGVIVEIFHRHAHSREARLQVEIARLKYVSPRLRESLAGGERQRGGTFIRGGRVRPKNPTSITFLKWLHSSPKQPTGTSPTLSLPPFSMMRLRTRKFRARSSPQLSMAKWLGCPASSPSA
jgi:GTPase